MNTEFIVKNTKAAYRTRWAWKASAQIIALGALVILFVFTHRHHIAKMVYPAPSVLRVNPVMVLPDGG